jgi:hypothetical protein
MAKRERIREAVRGPLDPAYLREREQRGWQLVGLEWEREMEGQRQPAPGPPLTGEVPYGLRVAADCAHLEENPAERRVLIRMLELIVADVDIPRVAAELNREGATTREGARWSPVDVFEMLPRLIDVGPQVFPTEDWARRRALLFRFVGD